VNATGFIGQRDLPQGLGVLASSMLGGRCEAHRCTGHLQSERCPQTALYLWMRSGKAAVAYCAACAQGAFPEAFRGQEGGGA
jgi:hypothetical protein